MTRFRSAHAPTAHAPAAHVAALPVPLAGVLAALVALAAVLALPGAARAEGSVPSEVRLYVTSGDLVRQLDDVYGVNAAGEGVDFDDTTTAGTIERVHVWSAAKRAGQETEHPLDLVNEWIVPIRIAEEPVGVATIWINPASVAPELASFVADPELATALSEVPDGSSLVHDAASAAWLALDADGILTPLVPGTTGLSTPVPVDDVAILPPEEPPAPGGDPNTGLALAVAVVAVLFAVIVVALVVPAVRGRRDAPDAGDAGEADAPEAPDTADDSDTADEPYSADEPDAADEADHERA